jgi:hypothetical protein
MTHVSVYNRTERAAPCNEIDDAQPVGPSSNVAAKEAEGMTE